MFISTFAVLLWSFIMAVFAVIDKRKNNIPEMIFACFLSLVGLSIGIALSLFSHLNKIDAAIKALTP